MSERLEKLALELFPEVWSPSNLWGEEIDVNYEARQKWIQNAQRVYNLALQDIKEEVERRMIEDYNGSDREQNETAQGVCAGVIYFINNLVNYPAVKDDRT